jgi:hypothetical protein
MSGSCAGVGGVGSNDRRWVESAVDTGVMQGCESPHGRTAAEARRAQKEGHPGVHTGLVGGEVATEATAMAAHGAAAFAAGAASVVMTAGSHIMALYTAVAEGAELRDAHERDAVSLAVVWTASGALSREYVARVNHELRDVAGEHGGASKILTPLMKDDTRWQSLKAQTEGFVRLGHKIAARSGINSRSELAHRLKIDSRLSKAYRANLAFKHGVDSYVFENEQRRIARER